MGKCDIHGHRFLFSCKYCNAEEEEKKDKRSRREREEDEEVPSSYNGVDRDDWDRLMG